MSSKCSFDQTKMKFLGHVIEHGRIRMDPAKVQAIQEWQPPTNVSELRSFLGLANYYRKFVIDYSKIALPLTELLKKSQTWDWAGECQSAKPTLDRIISKERDKVSNTNSSHEKSHFPGSFLATHLYSIFDAAIHLIVYIKKSSFFIQGRL